MMKIINLIALAVIAIFLLPSMCSEQIVPGSIGVRRSLQGGISEQDFTQGRHLSLPMWHSWYQLNGTIQYLEYSGSEALDVRTKENNVIHIDLSIAYRIRAGEAWEIVRAGFVDSYEAKVKSTSTGLLREHLARFSNLDVQNPKLRIKVAGETLPALNEGLARYHIEATQLIIRGIRFRDQYERKLQNKQLFAVQGRLDEAREKELKARQDTETLEKVIIKDIALKREEWNRKIEEAKTKFEVEIAELDAKSTLYSRKRRAEADALYAELDAEGRLAEALAKALGEELKAKALSTQAGRTFSAIIAVRNFKLGDFRLNSSDPRFLAEFGSLAAWRKFFLVQ